MTEKIIELKPIKESTAEYEKIEQRIKKAFQRLIYAPLLRQLGLTSQRKILNAKDVLADALRAGRITYSDAAFRGQFSASISKKLRALGAKWDRKIGAYRLPEKDLPADLRQTISASQGFFAQKMAAIDKKLEQILPEHVAKEIKIIDLFDQVLWKVETEFQKSVENITVAPKLAASERLKIAEEWQNNMDLWIKNFTEEQIKELRQTVHQAIFAGNRYESLIKGIETNYGVSKRKAKFLARQETNLLMAKFKETRYTAAGVNEYRWGCVKMPHDTSPDPRKHVLGNVRYYHGVLEGQTFRWDDPPVTNKNPERRNNPGQDYNCRCFARPIVKF